MSKQISSKSRTPKSLCYNSWFPFQFPALAPGNPTQYVSLGLNHKFTHLAYTIDPPGFTAGMNESINIVSGIPVAPSHNTSYGWVDLGGTFAAGDTITVTVAGTSYVFKVSARDNTLQKVAAALVSFLMRNLVFSASFIANSLGLEFVIQPLVYNAVTYPYSVLVVSAAGTATAGGANMVAGTGVFASPSQPITDQTQNGIIPSPTAVTDNALFPVDIILPTFAAGQAGKSGVVYAYRNYDAIFPSASAVSLTQSTTSEGGGGGAFTLYSVPMDNHPMQPEEANTSFHLSQNVL